MLHARRPSAFTMIELVVVLVIISIAMALAAPSLRGWNDGAKLRDSADQFLAAARWTRARTILTARPHVLEIDASTNRYAVSMVNGQSTTPVPGEFGRATVLPASFRISLVNGGEGGRLIRFYPDARTTPALVRITSAQNESRDILCESPADSFRLSGGER